MTIARIAAFSTALLVTIACEPRTPARSNVVLICLDTVRADFLGCYGYREHPTTPALDALARESTLFEDCWATAGWTKPSVPSFLTGTYPLQHGVYEGSARSTKGTESDVLPQAATTLAEVFHEHGYATAAFVRNGQLRAGMGFEQGFDLYRDQAGDAREIRWRAVDWLDERPAQSPFFLYLHLLDAHWPYPIPDEYATRFAPADDVAFLRHDDWRGLRDAINDGETLLDAKQLASLKALYAASLRYIDDQLARLFVELERRGLAENTVVCIVSDHGEEFLEHGRIGHGHGLSQELLQVPWILKVPGRAARRVSEPVSLIDLFPTLLGAAGVVHDAVSEGVERLTGAQQGRPLFAEHKAPGAYSQAYRSASTKLVRELRPAPRATSPDVSTALIVGKRYEVDLRAGKDGPLRAARLRPRPSDNASALEVKGTIEDLDGTGFALHGIRVQLTDDNELYGEVTDVDGRRRTLANGLPVKARGVLAEGVLLCSKLKLYGPGSTDHALRAALESVDAGRIVLGGIAVQIDAQTQFDRAGATPSAMTRDDVVAALSGESAGRFVSSERLTELETPYGETPIELPERRQAALTGLDALVGDLLELRVWGASDRRSLSESDLQALRALGYVR